MENFDEQKVRGQITEINKKLRGIRKSFRTLAIEQVKLKKEKVKLKILLSKNSQAEADESENA